jgi:hypothetical protein
MPGTPLGVLKALVDAVSDARTLRTSRVARLAALALTVLAALGVGLLPARGAGSSGAVAAGSVELKGTYVLSGAISKRGSFVDPELVATSCAQIGKDGTGPAFVGGPNRFAVPSPLPPTGDAENISFTAGVIYKRPGSFTKEEILKGGGSDLIVGKNSYNAVAPSAKASMTVEVNGSGRLVFSNAPPVAKGPSLSGTVTWTCTT